MAIQSKPAELQNFTDVIALPNNRFEFVHQDNANENFIVEFHPESQQMQDRWRSSRLNITYVRDITD